MIGYWDIDCPVQTNHPDVKATAYVKANQTLISIGNFEDKDRNVMLSFNWKALGLNPARVIMEAPDIKDFQDANCFGVTDTIPVKGKQGWLLILKEK